MRPGASFLSHGLVLLFCLAAPPGAAAGEASAPAATGSDPCGFYRSQAFGRGLAHFSADMLWACEAIVARRQTAMELSERLAAVEAALERYRVAVIAEGAAAFARRRSGPSGSSRLGAEDPVKAALAHSTGALAALDSIRGGY